uniref:Large ribosomal subunit protein bL33c n=1 Tax=Coniogramme intermedia TaxID=658545 RepID=A0A7T8IKR8_9MONI|nr:ribosomal protein L33 [Coniogramme intermedia]YP_010879095.1 ribosomal protein L33 [Coniogramme japonica]QQO79439.1 ribosomal protein L33 [Coniogramme intermedia]WHE42746.1 ribosomal protein L33 [Coniogramme japonica]
MARSKDVRITIALECTNCTRRETDGKYAGISRYTTRKNRRNTPTRLELQKYCFHCRKHTSHKESKK